MLVGGVILEFLGSHWGQSIGVGGFVYLIAGAGVLCGIQAPVRFTALCGCVVMADCLAPIIWSLGMGRPLEFRSRVFDFTGPGFWTDYFLPAAYMFGESLLAFVVLRHRRLTYWTGAMKFFTAVITLLFLGRAALAISHEVRSRQLIRMFPEEVRIAEKLLLTHGGMLSSSMADRPLDEFMGLPSLHSVLFRERLSKRWGWTSSASVPPDQLRKATHWVKLPSGEWATIEFEFIVPEE